MDWWNTTAMHMKFYGVRFTIQSSHEVFTTAAFLQTMWQNLLRKMEDFKPILAHVSSLKQRYRLHYCAQFCTARKKVLIPISHTVLSYSPRPLGFQIFINSLSSIFCYVHIPLIYKYAYQYFHCCPFSYIQWILIFVLPSLLCNSTS
jgi:hypothetical protein